MASASTPHNPNNGSNFSKSSPLKSHFRTTVCLKDWWLEKPANNSQGEANPLAVAGITSREKRAVRVFSAPILKRCDVFTLETVDGVFVIIQGFINKARTEANGFSSEIVKHFLFGFPLDWDIYAKRFYVGESPLSSVSKRSQGFEPLSPLSNSIVKSHQTENDLGRTCTTKNIEEHYQDRPMSTCHLSKKRALNLTVSAVEDVNKTESCKKSSTENFFRSLADLEVENHGQVRRELTNSFSEVNMSKDEEILPKFSSLDGDNEIGNAEAVSAYKSGGQSVVKQSVNNSDTTGITPHIHDTRGHFISTKQKKKLRGGIKQSISRSATPRAKKPGKRFAYGSSTSHEQKDASSVSPLSPSLKRSRSGRLLLPRLEFWRDQRAIYDVDRQITAVKDLNLDALSGGSIS